MVCPLSRTSCKRTDFGLFRGMPSGNNSNNNYKGAQLEFRRAAEREYDAFPWNRTSFGCHRLVILFPGSSVLVVCVGNEECLRQV